MNAQINILDRLDRMPPWKFTATLYAVRWLIIIPLSVIIGIGLPGKQPGFPELGLVFLSALVLAPVLETLIECSVPYWIMGKLGWIAPSGRAWAFVLVAAMLMVLLHIGAWPTAMAPSLVTGIFLGYTYAHFAPSGTGQAFLHTAAFHLCINLIGCILIAAA